MLFDIHKAEWDDELLLLFDIPKAILPHVTDSFGELGVTDHEVCFQTADLIEAMRGDWGASAKTVLRVDGGMVASDWMMQRLADILGASVDRPRVLETTALGAAYLAGLQAGLYPPPDVFAQQWALERRFTSTMAAAERERKLALWRDAVRRTLKKT
jgi:glycerol kinase